MNLKEWFVSTFNMTFTAKNIKSVLLKASDLYYNDSKRIMSDNEYDTLREFYESKVELLPVGSPVVGNTLTLSHSYENFAGTLSKCKNTTDLKAWAKNKGISKDDFLCTIKADGHSITIEYEYDGKNVNLVKALTRGENGVGKDLTKLFKANIDRISYPKKLKEDFAIGYEAVILYNDFEKLSIDSNGKYKNPRSAIGGIFSTSGHQYFKYITLIPIRMKFKHREPNRLEELDILTKLPNADYLEHTVGNIKEISKLYEEHEKNRIEKDNLVAFMYDGLVVETLNEYHREDLGYTSREPNFATAIKFTPVEEVTEVLDVKWSVEGHSARFTPVVHFKPVIIRGNEYRKVSLANHARFKALTLHKGDKIIFSLRNDTLGYVEKLDHVDNGKGTKLKAPAVCPSCGDTLVCTGDIFLDCINPKCELNMMGNLYAFIEKTRTKNIGLEIVRSLYMEGVVSKPEDFLLLETSDIEGLEGFGTISAKNIINEINKSFRKGIKDYLFLGSLNINLISRTRAKLILENITYDTLLKLVYVDKSFKDLEKLLLDVDGIGSNIIKELYNGMQAKQSTIEAFDAIVQRTFVSNASSISYSFCHTGSAEPLMGRETLRELLESKGHKLVSGVSKKTNYLINNDVDSKTVKNTKAKSLGIPIISVKEALELIGAV